MCMKTINFAIDLGTTNSLIAKYDENGVVLYNNPLGLKQTLPSCVAYRGNRIVIGDKALDYLEKDAENVCMLFKRKMGSLETYYVPSKDLVKKDLILSFKKWSKNTFKESRSLIRDVFICTSSRLIFWKFPVKICFNQRCDSIK